jgi:hypothetical protein
MAEMGPRQGGFGRATGHMPLVDRAVRSSNHPGQRKSFDNEVLRSLAGKRVNRPSLLTDCGIAASWAQSAGTAPQETR